MTMKLDETGSLKGTHSELSQSSKPGDVKKQSYETLLQKVESEVRSHIGIEQQLKIYIDNMQAKIEEYDKAKKIWHETHEKEVGQLQEKIQCLSNKLEAKSRENNDLKMHIKTIEEECKSLEMKCAVAGLRKEKTERNSTSDSLITTYFTGDKNSRNYVKSTSNRTPFELYRSRVTPVSELKERNCKGHSYKTSMSGFEVICCAKP
jgi:hypothetical protein